MGSATAPPFHSWEKARDRAVFLAHVTGKVHRVKSVEPTPEWPWHRWRVEKTNAYVLARQQLQAGTRLQRRIDAAVGSHVPVILL